MMQDVILQVEGPGIEHPAFRDILRNPPLKVGMRLDHAAYDSIKDSLRRTAATLGFVEAQLTKSELRVDPELKTATATLILQTGPRYSFGSTLIEQRSLDESLLRRYLRYEDGTPYDATQLLRTQFALDDSQYFSTVEVLAGEPDAQSRLIPVSIRTEPNRRNRYAAGVGFATDSRARGTLTWENRRLNDKGHRLRAELKAAQVEQSFEARYLIPIGDPALEKFTTEWRYSRDELGDLDTRTTRLQPSITQVRGNWQRVFFASLSRVRTATADSGRVNPLDTSDTLVIPGISLASVPRGYLGEALFSRGLLAELRGSTQNLGAPDDYLQLRIEGERAFDLAPKWHFFVRGQLGATWISATENLPGTERFFAGGDRSVRGFGYTDLSPTDELGSKVGGRHLLTATAEVIRDLPRNFGVAAFVDVGNAFDDFGDPLQYSAGIGLRLRLPVVTLGIDIAQPLTNPACRSIRPDPRCGIEPGFDNTAGPRLHLNFSPKL
jgi:translocation and assembly module TamA